MSKSDLSFSTARNRSIHHPFYSASQFQGRNGWGRAEGAQAIPAVIGERQDTPQTGHQCGEGSDLDRKHGVQG